MCRIYIDWIKRSYSFANFNVLIASIIISIIANYIFKIKLVAAIVFLVAITAGFVYFQFYFLEKNELKRKEFILNMLVIILFTILYFGAIYKNIPLSEHHALIENNSPMKNISWDTTLYFSTVTITTLGYGDIKPIGIFRWLVMIEVLMGVIYLGLFINGIIYTMKKR